MLELVYNFRIYATNASTVSSVPSSTRNAVKCFSGVGLCSWPSADLELAAWPPAVHARAFSASATSDCSLPV